jgi:uncharacterized protein (TIGR02599 family)
MDNPPCSVPGEHSIRKGFTLVELLVSMGILTALGAMLVGVLSAVNTQWLLAQAQIEPRQSGRTILDLMASELRAAALPADLTSTNNLQFIVNPPATMLNQAYLNPAAIFWQAPIAHNCDLGNIAEVGYFVKWDTITNPGNPKAQLCRFSVDPAIAGSGSNPVSTPNPNFLIYSQASGAGGWLTPTLVDAVAPANSANNYEGWLADNVVALWVRCLDAYGQPITENIVGATLTPAYAFDSRKGYTDSLGNLKNGLSLSGSTQNICSLPASVDIAIVVLNSRSALRLTTEVTAVTTAVTPGNPNTFWTDIANFMNTNGQSPLSNANKLPQNVGAVARLYSTRVNLLNAK